MYLFYCACYIIMFFVDRDSMNIFFKWLHAIFIVHYLLSPLPYTFDIFVRVFASLPLILLFGIEVGMVVAKYMLIKMTKTSILEINKIVKIEDGLQRNNEVEKLVTALEKLEKVVSNFDEDHRIYILLFSYTSFTRLYMKHHFPHVINNVVLKDSVYQDVTQSLMNN